MSEIKYYKKHIFILIMISPIQYIFCTSIAMYFYAGGTIINPLNQGYNFWYNFFSDLGRITALSGQHNLISFAIFTISALIMSISLLLFILKMPKLFQDKKKKKKFNFARNYIWHIYRIFFNNNSFNSLGYFF